MNDICIDDSTGANTESVKVKEAINSKRNRPQTVDKTRARNKADLYVIEEKSPIALKKTQNQKSTAQFKRNDKQINKSELFNSGSKSQSRRKYLLLYLEIGRNEAESEIHLSTKISKSKPTHRKFFKQFDFEVKDTYIDPDVIKAYTGKSDGIK